MSTSFKRIAYGLLLGVGLSSSAFAATQTLSGTHVTFSFDSALVGLFGSPSVSGDTIFFTPSSFAANSSNGTSGLDYRSALLNVGITAKTGYRLTNVDLTEQGSYLLYQPVVGGSSSGPMGGELTGKMRVLDLATLAQQSTMIASSVPLTTAGPSLNDWTATANGSFAAWQTHAVNLTIDNILIAYTTSAPALAIVGLDYVGAGVQVTAVPEPESYALFLAGLAVIGWAARRRN